MTQQLYIFSGLGADERVFQRLDFSPFSPVFIKWNLPQKDETIEHYTSRILAQITTKEPTLIGLSFGGLIVVEAAKQIEVRNVILIASAKTRREIPFYYRFVGILKLHKLLPTDFLKCSNLITNWFFGVRTKPDKALLGQILKDTDPAFLIWAIDKVVNWSNRTLPIKIYHIHGSNDRILPPGFVKCDTIIKRGGRLMTLNMADEISSILKQQLRNNDLNTN